MKRLASDDERKDGRTQPDFPARALRRSKAPDAPPAMMVNERNTGGGWGPDRIYMREKRPSRAASAVR